MKRFTDTHSEQIREDFNRRPLRQWLFTAVFYFLIGLSVGVSFGCFISD